MLLFYKVLVETQPGKHNMIILWKTYDDMCKE